MKKFYTPNIRLQDYLEEHNLEPMYYVGSTAIYEYTERLSSLLDLYFIETSICRSK